MKNTFRYSPPRLSNNLAYAAFLAAALGTLPLWGEPLRHWLAARFTFFEVFVVGGFALYMLVFWATGAFYLALDRRRAPAWLYRHKIQLRDDGEPSALPPGRLAHTVRVVLANQLLGTLPMLVGLYLLVRWRGMGLDVPTPPAWRVLVDLVAIVLVEEVLFYAAHWLLHRKPLMKRFHRIHHEYKEPIGITTHYVHYVEHLAGNLVPVFAGIVVTGCHLYTAGLWITLAVVNAIHTHSGYAFPWMAWTVHHDFHHYNVRGNYGVLGLLDRLFGTHEPFATVAREQARGGGRAAAP